MITSPCHHHSQGKTAIETIVWPWSWLQLEIFYFLFTKLFSARMSNYDCTRHNAADSLPTSNLVCIKEVAIRTTFCHMINIAGIIYYTAF